jgi:hypothetical protein
MGNYTLLGIVLCNRKRISLFSKLLSNARYAYSTEFIRRRNSGAKLQKISGRRLYRAIAVIFHSASIKELTGNFSSLSVNSFFEVL